MWKNTQQKGFLLIELLIGVAVGIVVVVSLYTLAHMSVRISRFSLEKTEAAYLIEEGVEAVKIIRDNDWDTIAGFTAGTSYYPAFSGGTWSLSSTANTVDAFTRTVVFSDVYRDASDDIAASGTLDTGTREVTVTVTWTLSTGDTHTESLSFYVANIFSS